MLLLRGGFGLFWVRVSDLGSVVSEVFPPPAPPIKDGGGVAPQPEGGVSPPQPPPSEMGGGFKVKGHPPKIGDFDPPPQAAGGMGERGDEGGGTLGGLLAEGLVKRYGGREVLGDVSIRVSEGEVVGLLGPNGAGKTTCFYAIAGIIRPDRGRVRIGGEDILSLPMHERALRGLSYLPQESSIFAGLTALENVVAILEIRGGRGAEARKRALGLLEEMGVGHLAESSAPSLSGGERRRVEIARLLATDPRFLLMDEPFAAIEPIAVGDLQTMILNLRGRGIGVFVTDHNVRETLKICDRAYILDGGRVLCEGPPSRIVRDEGVRRVYLGEDFAI